MERPSEKKFQTAYLVGLGISVRTIIPILKNNLTALACLAVLGVLSQASALLSYFFEWVSDGLFVGSSISVRTIRPVFVFARSILRTKLSV